jgi:hypothetical protein
MTFTTVFDAANEGYSTWSFPAFGLIFIAIGALLVFAPDLMRRLMPSGLQGRYRTVFSWFFLIFASIWTIASFVGTYQQYRNASSCLRDASCPTVEGPVTEFIPTPYSGHSMESFAVDGHRFSYSDYVVTPGFHSTASHGGPIREGLYVRITYAGNVILRLETAQ